MDLNRRSFLGGLLGLAATPLIKPKRSFFSFFLPKKTYPDFNFQELQRVIGRATYGYSKPSIILVTEEQFKYTWNKLKDTIDPFTGTPAPQLFCSTEIATAGYDHCLFGGTVLMSKNNERPNGFWETDIDKYSLRGRLSRSLDVTSSLGRPT